MSVSALNLRSMRRFWRCSVMKRWNFRTDTLTLPGTEFASRMGVLATLLIDI